MDIGSSLLPNFMEEETNNASTIHDDSNISAISMEDAFDGDINNNDNANNTSCSDQIVASGLLLPKAALHFVQMSEKYADEKNLERDLATAKEHFARLKFTFLELESKRRFLDFIASDSLWSPDKQALKEKAEQEARVCKKHATNAKKENDALKETVVDLVGQLVKQHESYEKDVETFRAHYASDYNRNNNNNNKVATYELEELMRLREEMATIEAELQRAERQSRDLQQQRTAVAAEKQRLTGIGGSSSANNNDNDNDNATTAAATATPSAAGEIAELQERYNSLQARYDSRRLKSKTIQQYEIANSKLEEMRNWYREAIAALTTLGGVSVHEINDASIVFKLSTVLPPLQEPLPEPSSHNNNIDAAAATRNIKRGSGSNFVTEHLVKVFFDTRTLRMSKVEINPNNVILCEEIVNHAINTNDVCFLVRELHMRIANSENMNQQVNAITQRYATEFRPDMGIICVSFKCGVTCEIHMGEDFPLLSPDNVLLAKLYSPFSSSSSNNNSSKQALDAVKDQFVREWSQRQQGVTKEQQQALQSAELIVMLEKLEALLHKAGFH